MSRSWYIARFVTGEFVRLKEARWGGGRKPPLTVPPLLVPMLSISDCKKGHSNAENAHKGETTAKSVCERGAAHQDHEQEEETWCSTTHWSFQFRFRFVLTAPRLGTSIPRICLHSLVFTIQQTSKHLGRGQQAWRVCMATTCDSIPTPPLLITSRIYVLLFRQKKWTPSAHQQTKIQQPQEQIHKQTLAPCTHLGQGHVK